MVEDHDSPDTVYVLEFTLYWVYWIFICSVRIGQDRAAGSPLPLASSPCSTEEGLGQQTRGKRLIA